MVSAASRRFIPLFFYTAVALCLGFLSTGQGLSVESIVLSLGAGFLSWGLIEYGLHRFIFHYEARSNFGRKLLYQVHLSHHEDPAARDRIFASLYLSTPIAGL